MHDGNGIHALDKELRPPREFLVQKSQISDILRRFRVVLCAVGKNFVGDDDEVVLFRERIKLRQNEFDGVGFCRCRSRP